MEIKVRNLHPNMVNELMFMDRPDIKIRQQKINDIIRDDIIPSRREEGLSLLDSKPQKQLFLEIFSRLPQDTRKWHYHMNALKELRPLIDAYTRQYLDTHHGVVIKELEEDLKDQVEDQKIYYGDGEVDVNLYAQNKMNDLYGRLGNVLLKEMTALHHGLRMNVQNHTASSLDLLDEPRVHESMEQLNKRIDRASKKYLNTIAYFKIKARTEKSREK